MAIMRLNKGSRPCVWPVFRIFAPGWNWVPHTIGQTQHGHIGVDGTPF
jgi:hypothetical protein